jgi:tRNA1Val (adenine37-N6)-methyltransferase
MLGAVNEGIIRAPRRPEGWVPPGPLPVGALGRADLHPAAGEDLCCLSGDWRIFQQVRGHRWSLDDLVTAWVASRACAVRPRRTLDLGCGIGSVLMMVAWSFPDARAVGIEAQALSAGMARRSLAYNGADGRCEVRLGDLRDEALLAGDAPFDLVTGTPPYFPRGEGVESDKPQCAPCRFEHRGGVEAYLEAASRALAPGPAPFVMCAASGEIDRVREGARLSGLDLRAWLDVIPRAGKPPLVSVFTLVRREGSDPAPATGSSLVVRERSGAWSADFAVVRRDMGLPPALSAA